MLFDLPCLPQVSKLAQRLRVRTSAPTDPSDKTQSRRRGAAPRRGCITWRSRRSAGVDKRVVTDITPNLTDSVKTTERGRKVSALRRTKPRASRRAPRRGGTDGCVPRSREGTSPEPRQGPVLVAPACVTGLASRARLSSTSLFLC